MRIGTACAIAILLSAVVSFAQPLDDDGQPLLPRGLAPHEKELSRSPVLTLTPPPSEPVRAFAEWEEVEAIIVRWPNSVNWNLLWSRFLAPVALDLKIYVLAATQTQANSARNYFVSHNVPIDSMEFIVQPTNSVWIRDYGPWWVWRQNAWDRAIVDWVYNRPRPLDDAIPEWFANTNGFSYFGPNLVFTGGNFMVDGWGRGFCSELVFDENGTAVDTREELDSVMQAYMNLDTMYTFPRFFGIDHIDMSMKLLNDHTAILNRYPEGNAFNAVMDSCEDILTGITNPWGQPISVTRIQTPSWGGNIPYTYMNAVFVNNKVLMPIYNRAEDAAALAVWDSLLPGYEIYGFDCNSIVPSGGAIHCIVKEVIHRHLIRIDYAPLPAQCTHPSQARVRARITSLGTLDPTAITLYYSLQESGPWNGIAFAQTAADSFDAALPLSAAGTPIYYYVRAQNVEGNWTTMPRYGPEAHHATMFVSAEPRAPYALTLLQIGVHVVLEWEKVIEDINGMPLQNVSYRVYASSIPDSIVSPNNLIAEVSGTSYYIPNTLQRGAARRHFQVTAVAEE